MTEVEWLSSEDPARMLEYLCGSPPRTSGSLICPSTSYWRQTPLVSERKLHLIGLAWRSRAFGRCDDEASETDLSAITPFHGSVRDWLLSLAHLQSVPQQNYADIIREVAANPHRPSWPTAGPYFAKLCRDHPHIKQLAAAAYEHRPPRTCPQCQGHRRIAHISQPTPSYSRWADADIKDYLQQPPPVYLNCTRCGGRGMIEDGALEWQRLAVLGDALEEAGCTEPSILAHLRDSSATHVRGCWALDLVRAKE